MIIHKCDLCGKFLNEYDEQEKFGLHYDSIGYGSKYDGCNINIDMCCECFDKMMKDYIQPRLQFKSAITDSEQSIKEAFGLWI